MNFSSKEFIGFSAFANYSPAGEETNDEEHKNESAAICPVYLGFDDELRILCKGAMKRKDVTKEKSLEGIIDKISVVDIDRHYLTTFTNHFGYLFCRLHFDDKPRIRMLCIRILLILSNHESLLSEIFPDIVGALWMSCHDTSPEIATTANQAMQAIMPLSSVFDAHLSIMLNHVQSILIMTPETILSSDSDLTREEAEGKFDRYQCSGLTALSDLIQLTTQEDFSIFAPIINQKLWKKLQSKRMVVRNALFQFLSIVVKSCPSALNDTSLEYIAKSISKALVDDDLNWNSQVLDACSSFIVRFTSVCFASKTDSPADSIPQLLSHAVTTLISLSSSSSLSSSCLGFINFCSHLASQLCLDDSPSVSKLLVKTCHVWMSVDCYPMAVHAIDFIGFILISDKLPDLRVELIASLSRLFCTCLTVCCKYGQTDSMSNIVNFNQLLHAMFNSNQINDDDVTILSKTLTRLDIMDHVTNELFWSPIECALKSLLTCDDTNRLPCIALSTIVQTQATNHWNNVLSNCLIDIMNQQSTVISRCIGSVIAVTLAPVNCLVVDDYLLHASNLDHISGMFVMIAVESILPLSDLHSSAIILWKHLLYSHVTLTQTQSQMISRLTLIFDKQKLSNELAVDVFDLQLLDYLRNVIMKCVSTEEMWSYVNVKSLLDSIVEFSKLSYSIPLLTAGLNLIFHDIVMFWRESRFSFGSALILSFGNIIDSKLLNLPALLLSCFIDCHSKPVKEGVPDWSVMVERWSIGFDEAWDEMILNVMSAICPIDPTSHLFHHQSIKILDLDIPTFFVSEHLIDSSFSWALSSRLPYIHSIWMNSIERGILSRKWCLDFLTSLVNLNQINYSEVLLEAYHWACQICTNFSKPFAFDDDLLVQLTELCLMLESLLQINEWIGKCDSIPSSKACSLIFRCMSTKIEMPTMLKSEFKKLSGISDISLFQFVAGNLDSNTSNLSSFSETCLFLSCVDSKFKMDVNSKDQSLLSGFGNTKIKLQQPKSSRDLFVSSPVLYVRNGLHKKAVVMSLHNDCNDPFATIVFDDGSERQTELKNLFLLQDLNRLDNIDIGLESALSEMDRTCLLPYYNSFIDIGKMIVGGIAIDRLGVILSRRAWKGLGSVVSWNYCMNLIPQLELMVTNKSDSALSTVLIVLYSLVSNVSSPALVDIILSLTRLCCHELSIHERSLMLLMLSISMKSSWTDFGIIPGDACWEFVSNNFNKDIVNQILLFCLSDELSVIDYSVLRILQVTLSNISFLVVEMTCCAEGTRKFGSEQESKAEEVEVESWNRWMLEFQCEGLLNLMSYAKSVVASEDKKKMNMTVSLSIDNLAFSCYCMISSLVRFKLILRSKGLMSEFDKQHSDQEEAKSDSRWKLASIDSISINDGSTVVNEFLALVGLGQIFNACIGSQTSTQTSRIDCLNWMIICDFIDSVSSSAYLRASFSNYLYSNSWVRSTLRYLVTNLSQFRNDNELMPYDSVLSVIDRSSCLLLQNIICDVVDEVEDLTIMKFLNSTALSKSIYCLPSLVRKWFTDVAMRHEAQLLSRYIENVSVCCCYDLHQRSCVETMEKEMAMLRSYVRNGKLSESEAFSVKGSLESRQFEVQYRIDEVNIILTIKVPKTYPLKNVEMQSSSLIGTTEECWRRWVLGMTLMISSQDCCIADAIHLWKCNVDKELEGIEACPICYSILDSLHQKSLPGMQCPTCHHKFHSSCLLQWFRSSGNNKCVMCRQPFYN